MSCFRPIFYVHSGIWYLFCFMRNAFESLLGPFLIICYVLFNKKVHLKDSLDWQTNGIFSPVCSDYKKIQNKQNGTKVKNKHFQIFLRVKKRLRIQKEGHRKNRSKMLKSASWKLKRMEFFHLSALTRSLASHKCFLVTFHQKWLEGYKGQNDSAQLLPFHVHFYVLLTFCSFSFCHSYFLTILWSCCRSILGPF